MKSILTLVYAGLFLVGASFSAQADMPVSLRLAPQVRTETIRLSDVFDGVPAEKDREIATAPEAGQSVTYDVRVLSRLAEQYRLFWQPQGTNELVTLTRAAVYITSDMVQGAVRNKIVDSGVDLNASAEVVLDNKSLSIALPVEKEPSFALSQFTYDVRSKRFRTTLVVPSEKSPIRQTITGHLIVKQKVPVLTKGLQAGTMISANDIGWVEISDGQIAADVVLMAEKLVGYELRKDYAEKTPLHYRDVALPRLVLRGNLVTMKIQTPFMFVTAQGRALQDGAKGDVVRLKNTQSNRIIEGVVESDGYVRVGVDSARTVASVQ